MTKKQHTLYYVGGIVAGIVCGIAGTAFSMGAEKQLLNDTLVVHTLEIANMKLDDKAHEKATQQELDRFAEIIAGQITLIQSGIANLTATVGDLRTDVGILKAIMERMERAKDNLKFKTNSG